jgi:3-methyladenine DNA glycosylase/8-oxoguanine DNA glycosylase
MVLDVDVRQPREGARLPQAPRDPMIELEVPLRGPGGEPVDLWRTLLSHGFHDLPPMRLDEAAKTLELTVRVPRGKPRRIRVGSAGRGVARVEFLAGPRPSRMAEDAVRETVARVLRLDQDLSSFYALLESDAELSWAAAGAGRMLASPTVFEDLVKTLCTTNCSWSLTTTMVTALVTHLGEPAAGIDRDPLPNAFPTPEAIASQPESFFRDTVRAGYRAPYLRALAAAVDEGAVDVEAWAIATRAELPDAELERQLLSLPGIGPYAAAHMLMVLGRGSRLILDSWTRPKYARLIGKACPPADRTIERRFRRYGEHAGLAFWLFLTRDWDASA